VTTPLATIRYTVRNLVSLIVALRPPREMRRITARTIPTQMPYLMPRTRPKAVELLSDDRRRLRYSLFPSAETYPSIAIAAIAREGPALMRKTDFNLRPEAIQ
jgi:hypothetical protein